MPSELLAQIIAPGRKGFAAGIVVREDRVIEAADIVKYMRGWSRDRVREYCKRKGWKISVVQETRS